MFLGFSVTSIFTSQRGFVRTPWTPPPPTPTSPTRLNPFYSINAHVTRDREFMVAHNCHGKNKNLTAITKYLTTKSNTSRQKQNSFGFAVGICFCREVFGFCCEVFGFAVRSLVLSWGILFLQWGFCFCREVFGLPWGILFLPWGFWFCVRFLVLP